MQNSVRKNSVSTEADKKGSPGNGNPPRQGSVEEDNGLAYRKHLSAQKTVDMETLAPQERLSVKTDARQQSPRSSGKHRHAYKRPKREKEQLAHCKASLYWLTRINNIDIRVPSDLLWEVYARATGQLIGGAMQLLPSRAGPWTAHPEADGNCIPPVHPDEDLYPLYILQALSCDKSKDDRHVTREVLSEDDFRSLSTKRAVTELQALGVSIQQPAATLRYSSLGGRTSTFLCT